MAVEKQSGYEKAAVLLLTLGEDVASEVMKSLDAKDVRLISNYLSKSKRVEPASAKAVVKEFYEVATSPEGFLFGGEDYLRSVLTKAMGEDKAGKVMQDLSITKEERGFEALRWIDPRGIANLIRCEHPQTIALILAHMDADHAGQVVRSLPEVIKGDVMLRMATTENVAPGVIQEIVEVLNKELNVTGNDVDKKVGGPDVVASILNHLDRSSETSILNSIEQNNPELAEMIRQMMFVFEDLIKIEDRGIQEILKETGKEELVLALKTAGDELQSKILKNMSERAAQTIRDDMEVKGPVKLSEIEKAQQSILNTVKRLEEEGRIVIGGKDGEEVVV